MRSPGYAAARGGPAASATAASAPAPPWRPAGGPPGAPDRPACSPAPSTSAASPPWPPSGSGGGGWALGAGPQRRGFSVQPEHVVYSGPKSPSPKRVTLKTLRTKYAKGEPISMLTAYDYPSAVHVSHAASWRRGGRARDSHPLSLSLSGKGSCHKEGYLVLGRVAPPLCRGRGRSCNSCAGGTGG
jgi:hypothetical protein